MKTKIKHIIILFVLIISSLLYAKQTQAQQFDGTYQVFYDQLSPYGQWVNYPNYGYVWMPDVGNDFQPYYSNGYWIMTDYGMTWVSEYNWGWAPFHYGRWDYDNYYGWFWIPDNEWGPAWVIWRRSKGYYGWAPMQPGVSIMISFGNQYNSNYDHWVFVRERDIDRRNLHQYHVNHKANTQIIVHSTVINNTYFDNSHHTTYVSGPDRQDLRRNMGRNVRSASIYDINSPGRNQRNQELNIYRPNISNTNYKKEKVVPNKLSQLSEVKKYSERNYQNQNKQIMQPNHNREEEQQNSYETNEYRNKKEQTIEAYNNNKNIRQQRNENLNREKAVNQKTLNQRDENKANKEQEINSLRQKNNSLSTKKYKKAAQKSNEETLNKTNKRAQSNSNTTPSKERRK